MCIRDRYKVNQSPTTITKTIPVSYTHLDVYKRQAIPSKSGDYK